MTDKIMPYCGERSIEFLCSYVDGWNYLLDIFLKKPELIYGTRFEFLAKFVFSYAAVHESIKELYK